MHLYLPPFASFLGAIFIAKVTNETRVFILDVSGL